MSLIHRRNLAQLCTLPVSGQARSVVQANEDKGGRQKIFDRCDAQGREPQGSELSNRGAARDGTAAP
jgi:hypothetical protein